MAKKAKAPEGQTEEVKAGHGYCMQIFVKRT